MFNPYLLMVVLCAALAGLAALDSSLALVNVVPWFNGLRWLRVHFITLGMLTNAAFGLMAALAAARAGRPRPATRWDIWLLLNAGLLILAVGAPLVNAALMLAGGTLVFAATVLLLSQLIALRPSAGRNFYVAATGYLLLGIFMGTGLWLGWPQALRVGAPLEVHIHANNWGFMSLLFAGLIIDLYPGFAGRPLAWPRSSTPIFWLMTVGAFALVLSPWFLIDPLMLVGILMHLAAIVWLLLNVIRPLAGEQTAWAAPGLWHVITSYIWILAPVLAAPLIMLGVPGVPRAGIEQNAPLALIYGWVLQFGCAILPAMFSRALQPDQAAKLGGSWLSLVAAHAGALALWAGIFIPEAQALLSGAAHVLWAIAIVPIALQLWRILRAALERLEAIPTIGA